MAHRFGDLVFTPAIKALQEKHGSRRQYARMAGQATSQADRLGPAEEEFLADQDSFYMASVGESGWPYVQHRGGPAGFLTVLDDQTIAFADFRGNKQYVSAGNLLTDSRVALIVLDYPRQARLKILGRVEILEGDAMLALLSKVQQPGYPAAVERIFVIHVEAFDWNCPQHVTPRYTAEQIRDVLKPVEEELLNLRAENDRLRKLATGTAAE
jgi:uncharacterized protein